MRLSEEVKMLRDMVDEFGRKELLGVGYLQLELKGEFPRELVAKLSRMDLMGMSFPARYSGMAMGTIATSVVAERLAFYWPSLHIIWSANGSLAGFPIMKFGNKKQKERFLPRLATGEILGCYALTEPEAGSDAANIQASAERLSGGRGWALSGAKTFITNADEASVGVVFAKVKGDTSGKRHGGITAFLVESEKAGLKIPGLTINVISKWGLCCSHFCDMFFDSVVVPEENVLGEVGKGFGIAMETLNNGRINIAAQAVGIARRALHEAKEYAKMRRAFDMRLIDMDTRAFPIAELEAKIDAAWQMTLHASQLKDSKEDYRGAASKAKLVASEVAVECALENFRVSGGNSCTKEHTAMSILHDALATIIYEGASDIQKLTIARSFRA